jgi:hypothetical protein
VTVEYRIDPQQARDFTFAMQRRPRLTISMLAAPLRPPKTEPTSLKKPTKSDSIRASRRFWF